MQQAAEEERNVAFVTLSTYGKISANNIFSWRLYFVNPLNKMTEALHFLTISRSVKLNNHHTPRFKQPDLFIALEILDNTYKQNILLKY
jgi:hypothetical protein